MAGVTIAGKILASLGEDPEAGAPAVLPRELHDAVKALGIAPVIEVRVTNMVLSGFHRDDWVMLFADGSAFAWPTREQATEGEMMDPNFPPVSQLQYEEGTLSGLHWPYCLRMTISS